MPTAREIKEQVELLQSTPYGTLAEKAEVNQWRTAFGSLQFRVRDLQKMVLELAGACTTMAIKIDSLEHRLNSGVNFVNEDYVVERELEDDTND